MKKTFLTIAFSLLTPCLMAKPLNVVFILADDLGWRDLGCFGSSFYETPHLDNLAKSGTRFTQAYAACPVCSPTRSSILTGQYPARTKNTNYFGAPQPETAKTNKYFNKRPLFPAPYIDYLDSKHTTLAEALKAQGYATFFAGKWHLGGEGSLPKDHGFDINKGGTKGGGPYSGKKYFSPYNNPNLKDGPDGEHLPDRLAAETAKFIAANKDKPFLAYLSFYSVHTPLMGRKDLIEKYEKKRKQFSVPESLFGSEHPRKVRLIQEHAIYGSMVEAMDLAVGKVLKALKDNGLEKNTLVIFFSDNGGLSTSEGSPTSNLPLRAGKGWLYEGGIREPMIVRLPGVTPPNSTSNYQITSTDFFPTILEAAKLDLVPKQHIDGKSFLAAMQKPDLPTGDRPLFWHYPHWGNQGGTPGSVIRQGDWKLIRYYVRSRKPQLFNIKTDPEEKKNIYDQHPDKVEAMGALLDAHLKETQALFPTINPNAKQ